MKLNKQTRHKSLQPDEAELTTELQQEELDNLANARTEMKSSKAKRA